MFGLPIFEISVLEWEKYRRFSAVFIILGVLALPFSTGFRRSHIILLLRVFNLEKVISNVVAKVEKNDLYFSLSCFFRKKI